MEHKDLKAETWLAAHHPSPKEWIVRQHGVFSRNYSGDLRECQPEQQTIELSRDGLYETLPQHLFFTGRELADNDKEDFRWTERVLKQRLERIKTVFLPFDSFYFNHSLALENQLNTTLADKNEVVMKDFLGLDFSKEKNPYVRKLAPMVAQAARVRGDYRFLCQALGYALGYKTTYKVMPDRVRFIVHRPDLDRNTFLRYLDELRPLFQWVEEWFLPFELQCEYKVRDYTRDDHFAGPNKLMLDYNATLGNKPQQTLKER